MCCAKFFKPWRIIQQDFIITTLKLDSCMKVDRLIFIVIWKAFMDVSLLGLNGNTTFSWKKAKLPMRDLICEI